MDRAFVYTYVLLCSDGEWYVGHTVDLEQRLALHAEGRVRATAYRLPVVMVYYEACRSFAAAVARERQLKTGFGRAYLKRRLGTTSGPD